MGQSSHHLGPLVLFPDDWFGLSPEQKAALCLFELLRRVARIGLLARGLEPRLADDLRAIMVLQETAVGRLFGESICHGRTRKFFADVEIRINAAVLGESIGQSDRARDLS